MMNRVIYILPLATMLLTSCFQEDDPVPPYQSPDGVTTTVAEMGPDYSLQLFYDIGTNQFIASAHRESWDLAFQCGTADYHVFMNSSKLMAVYKTSSTDFNAVVSDAGATWAYDNSNGDENLTAIGEWGTPNGTNVVSSNFVYIVDRGLSTTGSSLGKKKIQILGLTEGVYTVKMADLNGNNEQTLQIAKEPLYNYIFLSLDGQKVIVEPPKADWDLVFTQYTTVVYSSDSSIVENYSVNGILLNSYLVEGARDFTKSFENILFNDLSSYNFVPVRDIIGYDWKFYNFDTQKYEIYAGRNFLVKDVEGYYYKVRFISFVNDQGVKGYPKFEFSRF